jgi:outer membrane protein assembly factor BamB
MKRLLAVLAFVLTLPILAAEPAPSDANLWLQWRGPTRDGQVSGSTWPSNFKGLEQLWRVDLAEGYPGPIVAADRVFVAETKDRKEEIVRCLDRKTGKQLWEYGWPGSMTVPFFAARNGSWIRSTPAYDGECLYVAGMRDVLVCLDGKTGKERWRADLMARFKSELPTFGFVCSPLVDGDAVYVQAGGAFVKLNKKTGETIWRTLDDKGGMMGSAFSSPTIATLQGRRQILVQTRTTLAGVDETDGKVLWSQKIPAMRGMNILTPTTYKDSIFTSAHSAKTYRFDVLPTNTPSIKTAWELPMDGYMSSPVLVGKYAYLHLRNQRVACIDVEQGKTMWTTSQTFGKYWSMAAQGDRILALDERGILYLLKANPDKFELLDERKISNQETWGHLAVAGDEIYVRELKGLIAFRWKQADK